MRARAWSPAGPAAGLPTAEPAPFSSGVMSALLLRAPASARQAADHRGRCSRSSRRRRCCSSSSSSSSSSNRPLSGQRCAAELTSSCHAALLVASSAICSLDHSTAYQRAGSGGSGQRLQSVPVLLDLGLHITGTAWQAALRRLHPQMGVADGRCAWRRPAGGSRSAAQRQASLLPSTRPPTLGALTQMGRLVVNGQAALLDHGSSSRSSPRRHSSRALTSCSRSRPRSRRTP